MAMQVGIIQGSAHHDLIKHIPAGMPGERTDGTICSAGGKGEIHYGMKCISCLESFRDGGIFRIIVKVAHQEVIGGDGRIVLQGLCEGGGGNFVRAESETIPNPLFGEREYSN